MKILNKLKLNSGAIMSDVIVGIMIIIIFTGILTTGFYQIYKHNASIRINALGTSYAIKILEDIDKMTYEEVNNELNNNINQKYNIDENYKVKLEIENYNKDDDKKEDIIKIVKLRIEYKVFDADEVYEVQRLKIKEM